MRLAVVGAGVSGLVAAWLLRREHEVTVFESERRAGGHTHTRTVIEQDGAAIPVDTGFIVYNERNYPLFTRLLRELGVATKPAPMSFSVACEATGLEYGGETVEGIFAQRRNLARPAFLRMLADIRRFGAKAGAHAAEAAETLTLGEYLDRERYSGWFVEKYLVPMGSAIWSAPEGSLRRFPVRHFVRFFDNHGMLRLEERPQWRSIEGGSKKYVEKLTAGWRGHVRTGAGALRVERDGAGATVRTRAGAERFDAVVMACHSDQALGLLDLPTAAERETLGAIPYQANECVLHHDESLLPTRREAWSAWNYHALSDHVNNGSTPVAVTYCMSLLQRLPGRRTYCVTLNQGARIDPAKVLSRHEYHHPVYTAAAFGAQRRWAEVSGAGRTHYCGAYWGDGFHEDGVRSAVRVAESLGARW